MVVMQKSFVCSTIEALDVVCNQFRVDNPKFKFIATQIHIIPVDKKLMCVAVLFYESYK